MYRNCVHQNERFVMDVIYGGIAFEVAHVYEENMAEQMQLVDKFCDTLSKLQRLCDTM